jgi:pimeloyl-ACP methyl ester carboxylesterase
LPALVAAMTDADVVPLDLPGTGARLHEHAPRTIGENVERVRESTAFRDASRGPVFLFGLSLGGMIAMEWAVRHPEELAGVVVAASSATDVASLWERFSPEGFLGMGINLVTKDPLRRHTRTARLVLNRRDLVDETARLWVQIERERPISRETLLAQMGAAGRWRAPRALTLPLLLLAGAKDRLVHPDCSRRLARRYHAPLIEHPDAGHDLTTDATAWVVDRIVRFHRETMAKPARDSVGA